MTIDRRTFLGGLAAASVPATAMAVENKALSIDEFLARALPSERARYHAEALTEVMAEMHPSFNWHSAINHDYHFVVVNGLKKKERVVAIIDDGSPLLADDVTGTTAFADWEASR